MEPVMPHWRQAALPRGHCPHAIPGLLSQHVSLSRYGGLLQRRLRRIRERFCPIQCRVLPGLRVVKRLEVGEDGHVR